MMVVTDARFTLFCGMIVTDGDARFTLFCGMIVADPYVKIWLMYDGKHMVKQKTRCKPKTLNPDFNETFVFSVAVDHMALTCLSIVVMDRDIIKQNEMIGRIVLGVSSGSTESRHWKEMLAKSEQAVERWHVLKNAGDKYYTT